MTATTIDSRTEEFVGSVLGDVAGATTTILASIGERYGLFKSLHADGPATSAELAGRTATAERYVREWLAAMNAAGWLAYDPGTTRFELPAAHAPVLAEESGPMFFGGTLQLLAGFIGAYKQTREAFRTGAGTPQSAYPRDAYDGIDRFTAGWHENLLLQEWIPSVPDALAKLESGTTLADVGCGRGRALIRLAERFPRSTFVGFDVHEASLELARAAVAEAGVADRVTVEQLDASQGLPGRYGIVTTFDVVHDAAAPEALLGAIARALEPDGIYLCLDINCSDKVEENVGPIAALFYGCSVLYCMTTAIAAGGEGLGTCGLSEPVLRKLAANAGFSAAHRVPMENPFNCLYDLRV